MHAPSPITKPARVASNGREAQRRIVLLGDEPAHRAEPGEDQRDRCAASVPPARTTSAWPRLIISAPSPTACEPVAQAETGA